MDIDASRSKFANPVYCYRCKKPGHIAVNCLTRIDVRALSADDRESLYQDLLAFKDAERVPTEEPTETESADEEEDFA